MSQFKVEELSDTNEKILIYKSSVTNKNLELTTYIF